MNAFDWLNDLMRWVGQLVPRLLLVKATECGVLFMRAGKTRLLPPGLWVYWPLISQVQVTPTTQRTIEICAQLVGEETISTAIFWRVYDPVAALTLLTDITGNLDDYAQAALSRAATGITQTNEQLCVGMKTTLNDRVSAFENA